MTDDKVDNSKAHRLLWGAALIFAGGFCVNSYYNLVSPSASHKTVASAESKDTFSRLPAALNKEQGVLLHASSPEYESLAFSASVDILGYALDVSRSSVPESFAITRVGLRIVPNSRRDDFINSITKKVLGEFQDRAKADYSDEDFNSAVALFAYCSAKTRTVAVRDKLLDDIVMIHYLHSRSADGENVWKKNNTAIRSALTGYRGVEDVLDGKEVLQSGAYIDSITRSNNLLRMLPSPEEYRRNRIDSFLPEEIVRLQAGLFLRVALDARHNDLRLDKNDALIRKADALAGTAYEKISKWCLVNRKTPRVFYEDVSELCTAGLPTLAVQKLRDRLGEEWW